MEACTTIVFTSRAYNGIVNESFLKDPVETGGILLGHILDNGLWIVMEVLPPGNNSIFQIAYFEYDHEFVNYLAQSVSSQYKESLCLLGLWHRHPGSMDVFSKTDDTTNGVYASLSTHGAVSGLVNIDPEFRLTMFHVSSPCIYRKVEFIVDDDLIPSHYFELKYYPIDEQEESKNIQNRSQGEGREKKKSLKSFCNRVIDSFKMNRLDECNETQYWYQLRSTDYYRELNEINIAFPDNERSVENGILSFVINLNSKESGTWMLQMFYDRNYDGTSGKIKVYIIVPEMNEFLVHADVQLPYVNIDSMGDPYLDFQLASEPPSTGVSVLQYSVKWIDLFTQWNNKQLILSDFKL